MTVPFSDARLLEVTAHLQSGAVLPSWYPAPLDGVLATVSRRRTLGAGHGSVVDHHTTDLPLVKCREGLGARWVWAASCAVPVDVCDDDVRWWHQRFDDAAAAQVVGQLPASTATGRYKSYRVPLVVTVTRALRWVCLGDRARVEDLVADVVCVGKKASQGEGRVVRWDVTDAGAADWAPVMWGPDGHPARPYPARAATWLGAGNVDVVQGTYRPPYWRPPLNGTTRTWQEVIAPWTSPQPVSTPV